MGGINALMQALGFAAGAAEKDPLPQVAVSVRAQLAGNLSEEPAMLEHWKDGWYG